MTIDDENSIYVGNLCYDCTEDSLRKIFDVYGAIVAIKIISDRVIGRKCYGFVTFKNPRSAVNAIKDMNGRTIGGRVVMVNDVRIRGGGRGHFNRENFHRDSGRNMDWDWDRDRGRGRGRGRGHDLDRVRSWDRNNDRSRERQGEYERPLDHDRIKDHLLDQDQIRDLELNEKERSKSNERICEVEHDRDLNRDGKVDETSDQDNDQLSKSRGSHFVKRRSRELSSSFSDDYHDQVKEELEISIQRQEELQKEISQIEEMLEGKHHSVSELKHKSQKLEDALASAKKLSFQRQMQLNMMQKYLMQVKDYTEKLKTSEQELQALIDAAMIEAGDGEDAAIEDVSLHTNGKEG